MKLIAASLVALALCLTPVRAEEKKTPPPATTSVDIAPDDVQALAESARQLETASVREEAATNARVAYQTQDQNLRLRLYLKYNLKPDDFQIAVEKDKDGHDRIVFKSVPHPAGPPQSPSGEAAKP